MPAEDRVSPRALRARLRELTLRDERRLDRKLDRARRRRDPSQREAALARVAAEIADAEQRATRRRAAVPRVSYPPQLPITGHVDDLRAALADHQVIVVAGETGSGKTTQLPKLCLEAGRGVRGAIGHTQPRRLAARSVATRVASELDVDVGAQVGYQVRFADQTSDETLVKVMTDGILLAETHRDPSLRAYDTLIIDEAHERSLNIDVLLGYLKQLLARRGDLKLIITSATIDVDRFARHFDDAPVVEVSGRTYPVEVRYRPPDDDRDLPETVSDAVAEALADQPGDVLAFVPTERDVHDTARTLEDDHAGVEVLPLYARLSAGQQQRVFQPHRGRRVVVATNVAETSLTVPGIRSVVDTGTARLSRYDPRTGVQRLPIEPISQASAAQRAGRCGREAPGVCIRTYAADDLAARPDYTEPEIRRTNLAAVVLQLTALGVADVAAFGFLDPPDTKQVRAAERQLVELHAIDAVGGGRRRDRPPQLTDLGRTLARLPVDPRLGRMLAAGHEHGCLREVLILAAALSIADPRERPADQRGAADAAHARFADEWSDFLGLLALWREARRQQRRLSGNAFRRWCAEHFLSHRRMREWQDLHRDLRGVAGDQGWTINAAPADADAVHQALLTGLLSHVGVRDDETRDYRGAHGSRFVLWPGSALASRRPPMVTAGELVETSRRFARTVAEIEPGWVERAAAHLLQRRHSEPRWDADRGAAVAEETVTLYGVPIVQGRPVVYTRIDPAASRELLLRHALVDGDWDTHHPFAAANRALLAELSDAEHRLRRRDVVVTDDDLYDFYDARVPADVACAADFEAWWRETAAEQPQLLTATREQLGGEVAAQVQPHEHPDTWREGDLALPLTYRFEPGATDDGVTVHVPVALLPRLRATSLSWQVPGLRAELVTALLRTLDKDRRRALVPVQETVAKVLPALEEPTDEPLTEALSRALAERAGVRMPADAFAPASVDPHLRMTVAVTDGEETVAVSKNLPALQRDLAPRARAAIARACGVRESTGQTRWTFGALPQEVAGTAAGARVVGYPAVVDEGESAGLRLLLSPAHQRRAMWAGLRRLVRLAVPVPAKAVHARLDQRTRLTLTRAPHGSVPALLDDVADAAVDALMADAGAPVWDDESFAKLAAVVDRRLAETMVDLLGVVAEIVGEAGAVHDRLEALTSAAAQPGRDDAADHLRRLVHPGFVRATGPQRLRDVARYVRGIGVRLDKLPADPGRDADLTVRVTALEQRLAALRRRVGPRADVVRLGWLLEELRVGLFAQQLGTRERVSERRLERALAEAGG